MKRACFHSGGRTIAWFTLVVSIAHAKTESSGTFSAARSSQESCERFSDLCASDETSHVDWKASGRPGGRARRGEPPRGEWRGGGANDCVAVGEWRSGATLSHIPSEGVEGGAHGALLTAARTAGVAG